MHEKHKGHDAMHAEMIIILLLTLIVAQVALVEWKKRHYRSYSVFIDHNRRQQQLLLHICHQTNDIS